MTTQPFLNSRYLCKFSTKIEHSLKKNLEHLCFDFKNQNTSELVFSASTKIIIIITTPNELATSKNALEKTQCKCPWLLKQLFSFNNGLTYFLFFFFFNLCAPYLVFIKFSSGEPLEKHRNQVQHRRNLITSGKQTQIHNHQ